MQALGNDERLLAEYAAGNSRALEDLVARYIDFVYSTARRQVHDPHLAEDVTQAVFIILSRKAAGVRRGTLLGWLFQTTRYAAANALKAERRRAYHEQHAARREVQMSERSDLEDITPLLNDALSSLNQSDRSALLMRYYQGRSVEEISTVLGVSDAAARKRMERAMERLRRFFVQHGEAVAPAVLPQVLRGLASDSAPAHLQGAIAASLSNTAGSTAAGYVIAKGAMRMMLWAKAKAAAIVLTGLLCVAGVTAVVAQAVSDGAANTPATAPAFRAVLANGVSAELIGAGHNPSTGKPWWRPDGSPLATAPYYKMGGTTYPQSPDQVAREFAVRYRTQVTGSAEPASVQWGVVGSGGWAGSTAEGRDGNTIPDLEAHAISVANSPDGVAVRFGIASGPWNTLSTAPSARGQSSSGADGMSYLFSDGFEVKGATHIVVTRTGEMTGVSRVVALDQAGATHVAGSIRSNGTGTSAVGEYVFDRLPVARIKEVQLQSRPFNQWIEFHNVSVDPAHGTEVRIFTSDNADALPQTPKQRAMHMRDLVNAALMYSNDHRGRWPTAIKDVAPYLQGNVNDFDQYDYQRPGISVAGVRRPSDTGILFEKKPISPDGEFVAFADGHVQKVNDAQELKKLKSKL